MLSVIVSCVELSKSMIAVKKMCKCYVVIKLVTICCVAYFFYGFTNEYLKFKH